MKSSTASTQPSSVASALSFAFSSSARELSAGDTGRGYPAVEGPGPLLPQPVLIASTSPAPAPLSPELTCESAAGVWACLQRATRSAFPRTVQCPSHTSHRKTAHLRGLPSVQPAPAEASSLPQGGAGFHPCSRVRGPAGGPSGPTASASFLLCPWSVCGGRLPQVSSGLVAQGLVLNHRGASRLDCSRWPQQGRVMEWGVPLGQDVSSFGILDSRRESRVSAWIAPSHCGH